MIARLLGYGGIVMSHLLLSACTLGAVTPNPASAFCPKADSARRGFTLTSLDRIRRIDVKPQNDDFVNLEVINEGQGPLHKTYRMTVKGPDGKSSTLLVENTVVGREVVNLEDCPLETLLIEGQTTFSDSRVQRRRANFSPVLRTFVRWTIANEGSQPVLWVYDRIEPSH